MDPILDVLANRLDKVDPQAIAQALEEALDAAGGIPPYPDPAETLPPDELDLLAKGGFEVAGPALGIDDPVLRGALESAAIRATALTTREAAVRLGVNDSRVRQRLSERTLYGLKARDGWRLPIFQFDEKGLVPELDRVLPRLDPGLSPIAVLHWLTTPNPDLASAETQLEPASPLVWLRLRLDPERVAELASQL